MSRNLQISNLLSERADSDETYDVNSTTAVSITVSILGIIIVLICLSATVYNIYNYLYKRKLNKLLITAFYVCFVLLLLTEILQFSLELSDMSLISYAFY